MVKASHVPTYEQPFGYTRPNRVWAAIRELRPGVYPEGEMFDILQGNPFLLLDTFAHHEGPQRAFHNLLMDLKKQGFIQGDSIQGKQGTFRWTVPAKPKPVAEVIPLAIPEEITLASIGTKLDALSLKLDWIEAQIKNQKVG